MAATTTFLNIADLKQGGETNTIIVRATRKWDGINNKKNSVVQSNIILLDKEDNHILAVIHPPFRQQFYNLLEEGSVFNISNFSVSSAPNPWKTVRAPLAIYFGTKTTISNHPDDGAIPNYKFELMPIRDIAARVDNITQLLDIIGCLKSISEMETVSKGLRKMDIILTDDSEHEATVTLWETNADYFLKEYSKHKQEHLVFVVVTSVVVKQYMGKRRIATSPASKIYLNIDPKEVRELREHHAVRNSAEEAVQIILARVQPTYEEQINLNRLTIAQLSSATIPAGEEFWVCTCEATIVDIVDNDRWFYNACVECFRKMKSSSSVLYCNQCVGCPEKYTQRFKVHVRVCDTTGEAVFVLFNSDTERLIGLSIDHIIQENKESGSITDTPPLLRNLQGMSLIFQLKISSYNTVHSSQDYTVKRVFQPNQKGQKRSLQLLDGNNGGDDASPSNLKRKIKLEKE